MGNTCKPMAVSFHCMTKFTTIKKKRVRKKKKNIHTGFGKMLTMTLYARQQKRHRYLKKINNNNNNNNINDNNRLLDSVDESKGGMIWEDITETCISPYMKLFTSPGRMHETGSSGLVPWDKPEGWVWGGCARGFRIGAHGWFTWMHGKNHYNYCRVFSLH